MPKYIYRMPGSDDELQHFDISDIGKGLSAAGKAIGDTFSRLTGQKKNKSGKTVKKEDKKDSKVKVKAKGVKKGEKKRTGKYKGGKKDREWICSAQMPDRRSPYAAQPEPLRPKPNMILFLPAAH